MATVMLTGASGFLGIHTVQALLDAGHDVRALVRTPLRLTEHLRPLGLDSDPRVTAVAGDMTDATAVREAVQGCDAVVHAAATFSFRRRDRQRMTRENAAGTRTVLEAGATAGCSHLVHVSSTVALARPGATLDHTSPLGTGPGPYSASKIASEDIARTLQTEGAPVTVVNPGGIHGPDDPYLGESNESLTQVLRGRLPAWPRGSLQYVDVRDVAAVLTACLAHPPGGRYLVPGHDAPRPHEVLRQVTGRRLPAVTVPVALAVATAMPGYLTGSSLLPNGVEGARIIGFGNRTDASRTTADLGVEARPLADGIRDTVRWLVAAGHLGRKQAGAALVD